VINKEQWQGWLQMGYTRWYFFIFSPDVYPNFLAKITPKVQVMTAS
jgi:hypothetical protein